MDQISNATLGTVESFETLETLETIESLESSNFEYIDNQTQYNNVNMSQSFNSIEQLTSSINFRNTFCNVTAHNHPS